MILTTCAACAAPLAHNAPRCVRCQTRYCNQTCQHALRETGNKPEAKKLLRARIPVAERSLGREHYIYLRLRWLYANSLCDAADATLDDLVQAEALLDDTYTRFRRIMGGGHPDTPRIHKRLLDTRKKLAQVRASSSHA